MSISIRATGIYDSGTGNLNPVIPVGAVTGDMMLCFYGTKPFNDAPSINNGWTDFGFVTDGVIPSGMNTGSMQIRVFYKIHTGAEANPTISTVINETSGAVIIVFQKASSMNWAPVAGAGGGDATAGTGFSVTVGSNPGITAGDMLVGYAAIRAFMGSQSSITITATGLTMGAFTESPASDLNSVSGDNMSMSGGYALVTSGTAVANPVYSSTLVAAHTGSAFIIRLREVSQAASTTELVATGEQSSTILIQSPNTAELINVIDLQDSQVIIDSVMTEAASAMDLQDSTHIILPQPFGDMWILLTVSIAEFSFQLKASNGVDIGLPYVYSRLLYRIRHMDKNDQFIVVYLQDREDGSFPFIAQFPRERTVAIRI